MNDGELRTEVMLLGSMPGYYVTSEVPRSYLLKMDLDYASEPISMSIRFFVPTTYPKDPPLCQVEDHSGVSDSCLAQVKKRLEECSMFLHRREKWMTYVAEEVKAILLKPHTKHTSGVHLPDAIEASKLQIEASLNRTKCGNWIRNRTTSFPSKERVSQNNTAIDAFLVYSLFRACKGKLCLEECLSLLINQLHLIESPGPPVDLIPRIVCQLHEECKTLPSYVESVMFSANDSAKVTAASFFNDFSVIGLCGDATVEARNLVDRRVYAVKAIVMHEDTKTLPQQMTQLTQLQHRYIVRYYNSWLDECDETGSMAISDAFCLPCPIRGPATFMFLQMDYCEGKTLRQHMRDSVFFEEETLRQCLSWQILEALLYLHSKDVVYNAISADNIFIEHKSAKLGDFSERNAEVPFPYRDPRGVVDAKSDMFAFGILYFELWYPFSSEEERTKTLTELVENRTVPKAWSKVFPMQATIVSLLMQPAEHRPMAVDLLQSKLIPFRESPVDESELRNLTRAISQGNITLDSHAPQVLAALFAESRRLPFRLSGFPGAGNANLPRGKFQAFAIAQFFNLASLYGGRFINVRRIHSSTDEEGGIVVMSKDGALHGLYTSISRAYVKWAQQNGISSIRLFSKHTSFRENGLTGEIQEVEMLTFDIIHTQHELENVIDGLDFTVDFLSELFPNSTIKLKISHSGIAKEVKDAAGMKHGQMRMDQLKRIARDWKGAPAAIYSEICAIYEHFNSLVGDQALFVVSGRAAPNSLVLRLSVNDVDTAIIGATTYTKTVSIVSARVPLSSLFTLFDASPSYPTGGIEIAMILAEKFRASDKINEIRRGPFSPKKWGKAYVLVQKVAAQLRKDNISTWIAPNDGKSVEYHIKDAGAKSIHVICVCYIDDCEKVVVRFIGNSEALAILKAKVSSMKAAILQKI